MTGGWPDFKWWEVLILPFLLVWDFIKDFFKNLRSKK